MEGGRLGGCAQCQWHIDNMCLRMCTHWHIHTHTHSIDALIELQSGFLTGVQDLERPVKVQTAVHSGPRNVSGGNLLLFIQHSFWVYCQHYYCIIILWIKEKFPVVVTFKFYFCWILLHTSRNITFRDFRGVETSYPAPLYSWALVVSTFLKILCIYLGLITF